MVAKALVDKTSHRKNIFTTMTKWNSTTTSGGRVAFFPGSSTFPCIASKDGRYSIVVFGQQLRVFFHGTRQCVRVIEHGKENVISGVLDPNDDSQVVIATGSNEVLHVKWQESVAQAVVAKQKIQPGIPGMHEMISVDEKYYHVIGRGDNGKYSVWRVDKENARSEQMFVVDIGNSRAQYGVSRDGSLLAVIGNGGGKIYPLSSGRKAAESGKSFSGPTDAACVAVSNDGVVAVGTRRGPISMIYPDSTRNKGSSQSLLKWHMEPPQTLCFSHDGRHLLSGGLEKVLVQWNLSSGHTQFLPRLGGLISRIFVDAKRPDSICILLSAETPRKTDRSEIKGESLVIVSAADFVSRLSVIPPKIGTNGAKNGTNGSITYNPGSSHLYIPYGPSIQAFDITKGETAFIQDVAPHVNIGKVRRETQLSDPVVDFVAFSSNGEWMCTADSMPRLDVDNLMSKDDTLFALKFWRRGEGSWILTAKIVDPHGPNVAVGALVFVKGGFLSVGVTGGLRYWTSVTGTSVAATGGGKNSTNKTAPKNPDTKNPDTKKQNTTSKNSGAGKNSGATSWTLRRALPPFSQLSLPVTASISQDQSIIVVTHGCNARIFNISLNHVPMDVPPLDSPILFSHILPRHLVLASARSLRVFDLVAARATPLSIKLFDHGANHRIACDPARNSIAVVHNHSNTNQHPASISIFDPASLLPTQTINHHRHVISITSSPLGFVIIDSQAATSVVAPQIVPSSSSPLPQDIPGQMRALLASAQSAADILHPRPINNNTQFDSTSIPESSKTPHRALHSVSLEPVFANADAVPMAALFEKLLRVVH